MGTKYSAVEKVAGGKLVGVDAWVENDRLEKVRIIGDFFLHPEDGILELEKALTGKQATADSAVLEKDLQAVVDKHGLLLVGFTPEIIVGVLKKALSEQK